ncbi:hypothetical protein BFW01_g12046 [Lasiodiplodia theobromae]|nr:hypothetical protein BFW01_g12046 [Lasiodiplodia theobromae]
MTVPWIYVSSVARLSTRTSFLPIYSAIRQVSSSSNSQKDDVGSKAENKNAQQGSKSETAAKPKTQAQLDDELKARMAGLSGDGGEAGIEYENGEPVAMKRSVRNNMFRYI